MGKPKLPTRSRELLEYAEENGWEFAGYTGSGHIRIRHGSGAQSVISHSPGDYRGDKNKKAEIRRANRKPVAG